MTEKELCEAFAAGRIEKRRTLISSGACWEMMIPRRVLSAGERRWSLQRQAEDGKDCLLCTCREV